MTLSILENCAHLIRLENDFNHIKFEISASQQQFDQTVSYYLENLRGIPIKRWQALCEAADLKPVMATGASYCDGFEWSIVINWVMTERWFTKPLTWEAYIWGVNNAQHKLDISKLSLAKLIKDYDPLVVVYLLVCFDALPMVDISISALAKLDARIAIWFAWFWLRDGFTQSDEKVLVSWLNRDSAAEQSLGFWALVALITRRPKWHDKINLLNEQVKEVDLQIIALVLRKAVADGPFQREEAEEFFIGFDEANSRLEALKMAFRLATFAPGSAPFINPYIQWNTQTKLKQGVSAILQKAISAGSSFIPDVYLEKERMIKGHYEGIAKAREKVLKNRFDRGWNDITIQEALTEGEGVTLSGFPYGEALLFSHSLVGAAIVVESKTQNIIHVGRPEYLYNIDLQVTHQDKGSEKNQRLTILRQPVPIISDLEIIYVRLRDEGVEVWRPIEARRMYNNVYCIMPQQSHLEDERWEFSITAYVECAVRRFARGVFMTAIRLADRVP